MKIKNVLIWIIALFGYNNLHAQYKLELEWQKDMERIVSITKSDNDSLLYVAFENFICTVKTSDGSIAKTDTVDGTYNLMMSRDGKTLVASSGTGVGLLDPQTFKQIYFNYTPRSDYNSLSFNEKSNKYLICGNSSGNPISSFIKIYDIKTKSLFKEFLPSYFGQHTNLIEKAWITDDSKYIIYSMASNLPLTNKSFLKMIDLEGKVVKDFGETSSTQFTLTNDGKTLIYFMPDAIHFLDLENMKEIEGIQLKEANPEGIEMSNDGNFILLGYGGGLVYIDLETKKTYYARDFGTWRSFKLNKDNSSLFSFLSNTLYKFNFQPTNIIGNSDNKHDFKVQLLNNDLILTSQSEINPTCNFQIINLNGKLQRNILASEIQHIANGIKIDINTLSSGVYFLQIQDDNSIVSTLKFLKMD